jgi:hypothetical protein
MRIIRKGTTDHWVHAVVQLVEVTTRKVAGSIPDGLIGNFHWNNPSSLILAVGLAQPLTEMSTRNISWEVKVTGAQGWQLYHPHVPTVLKSGDLILLEPCPGL